MLEQVKSLFLLTIFNLVTWGFFLNPHLSFAYTLVKNDCSSSLETNTSAFKDEQNNIKELQKIQSTLIEITSRLKAISIYMGKNITIDNVYQAKQVPDRVLYFQANRLYKKLLQLEFEILGTRPYVESYIPKITSFNLQYVQGLINKSNQILLKLEQYMHISSPKIAISNTKTSNVLIFKELIELNQIVNSLLEVEAQPSDVYKNITLAIYYTGTILSSMPNAKIPTTPDKFIPNLKPKNVFQNIFAIFNEINQILTFLNYNKADISILSVNNQISPNDVQSLSELVLSELYLICMKLDLDVSAIKSYYPGKKYPSDVYQRSTILMKQVKEIKKFIKNHPEWLKKEREKHEK